MLSSKNYTERIKLLLYYIENIKNEDIFIILLWFHTYNFCLVQA